MCGKYYADREFIPKLSTLFREEEIHPDSEIQQEWERISLGSEGKQRSCRTDISPTDSAVTVYSAGGRLVASKMAWGFRDPYHDTLVINARSESALEKKMFADSIRARRCVIPASGYYEWDKAKAKYTFSADNGDLVLLAGFYRLELGEPHFTILTAQANCCMAPVHSRMPVTVEKSEIKSWLTDDSVVSDYLERRQKELIRVQDSGQISMDLGV